MYLPLDLLVSFGTTISSFVVAFVAIFAARELILLKQQQRINLTVNFLANYPEKIIFPTGAFNHVPPKEFASTDDFWPTKEKVELIKFANSMEYVAMLVRNRAVDERLAKEYLRGSLVAAFKKMQFHIMAVREATSNPSCYFEFEALARRWEADQ